MAADWRAAAASQNLPGVTAKIPATSGGVAKRKKPLDYYMSKLFTADDIKGRMIAIYSNEGVGKTVLAAKLGKSNLFITDDNGILSLKNHSELDAISVAVPFEGYDQCVEILQYCESGEMINPKTGTPFDNVIFDTISGMCSSELRRSIEDGDIKTDKGKLAGNIPTQPHYLLNEQNFAPLMKECGRMMNVSVTLLVHLRTGTKDIPGASTRADLHGAAYKLLAKYSSVVAYMMPEGENGSPRKLRVMPDLMTGAKTRHNFRKAVVTDDEFVAEIEAWKLPSS